MHLRVIILLTLVLTIVANQGEAAPDTSGKVVLANLDRYDVYLRVGQSRREIKPRKASVLTPKRYPVTIELAGPGFVSLSLPSRRNRMYKQESAS